MQHLIAALISTVLSLGTVPVTSTTMATVSVIGTPKVVKIEKPAYPEFALRTHAQGKVIVEVMVGTDGKAKDVRIISSASPVFEPAVIAASMNAEYQPAIAEDGAVEARVRIPFSFRKR